MILIISHAGDAHVPMVTGHLDRAGLSWALLATDRLGADIGLDFALGPCAGPVPQARLTIADGREVPLEAVRAVWNRRRIVAPVRGGSDDDALRSHYIREQRLSLLDGALSHLDARWVNSPASLTHARSKLDQLGRAAAIGLTVPDTLVSDDPYRVRAFAERHASAGIITKVISPGTPVVPDGARQYMIFTQRFAASVPDAQISAAPAIYQAEIRKSWEARAVIVGERVLCCKFDSQASPRTELDWRRYDFERVTHEQISLPDDFAGRLVRLCRGYGLVYGAIDLAMTPEGEWVFFELNPNGQWGWLEEKSGLPVGQALAAELGA